MAEWPFVGRDEERGRISFLLRGRPPMGIVLTGGQGVGKTRLASWARDEAAGLGLEVRHAVASTTTAGIPFGALAAVLPVLRELADTPQVALRMAAEHLVAEAGDGHLLLSIDDAHHLDDASIGLLNQVAASPRVAVLLTVRAPHPGLHAFERAGLAERIDVGPLTEEEVGDVLGQALDGTVSPLTVSRLHALSQGNPLYLRELVMGSLRQGSLAEVDGLWHVAEPVASPRLSEIVEERLVALGHDERHALEVVVVAGTIGYATLVDLADEAAVEALEREALITVTTEERRRIVAVAHPVHAEVVRGALTTRRTLQLNREVADALQASGARRRDDVLRIAVSRLEAGGEVSAPLMTEAARRALAAYDLVLGERLARLAYESGGGLPAGLDLGGALTRLGRHDEAAEVFESIDATGGSDRDRALLAMEWAECLFWGLGEVDRARAVLDEAWSAVEEAEWRDQLVVTGAAYALLEGSPEASLATVGRIREDGTARGVAAAGLIAGPALAMLGCSEDALAAIDRGLASRHELPDEIGLVHEGMLVMARTVALAELGCVEEAIALGTVGHGVAAGAGVVYAQAWFAMATGRAHLLAGDLDESDRWFRAGAAGYRELDMAGNRRWCLFGSGWALALQGEVEAADRVVAEAEAIGPTHLRLMEPETKRAAAALAFARGDRNRAIDLLLQAADEAATSGLTSQEVAALHDLVRAGVTDHVDRLVERAAACQGRLVAAFADHGRALAKADGAALGAASDTFADLGAGLLAAEAAAQASAALKSAGERRHATRWAARASELDREIGAAGSPALSLLGGAVELTEREREVATLATNGMASKDIAAKLGLSRRTVDNHLHRAYTKLGVDGREALAAALARTAEQPAPPG